MIWACAATHSHVSHTHSYVCRDVGMRVMTPSSVCHDPFICVPWLIHTCDMTHSYVWHGPFICVCRDVLACVPWSDVALAHSCVCYDCVCHHLCVCCDWFVCVIKHRLFYGALLQKRPIILCVPSFTVCAIMCVLRLIRMRDKCVPSPNLACDKCVPYV